MSTLPIHIDHLGEERKLSLLPPTPECQRLRAASRSISAITPIIPRTSWIPVDYLEGLPAALHLNQHQFGQCVAGSDCGANATMRYIRTGRILIASMAWVYDCINNGQDNGAVITDAQRVMLSTGAPTVDKYSINPQFRGVPPMPAGSVILKEDEAISIDTPEDVATGLISLEGLAQIGINVTSKMENFTPGGIAWGGHAPGGNANHSVFTGAVKKIEGIDVFRIQMGWGPDWGPLGDGTCYIPWNAVDTGGWLHLSTFDSDDKPPVPQS